MYMYTCMILYLHVQLMAVNRGQCVWLNIIVTLASHFASFVCFCTVRYYNH